MRPAVAPWREQSAGALIPNAKGWHRPGPSHDRVIAPYGLPEDAAASHATVRLERCRPMKVGFVRDVESLTGRVLHVCVRPEDHPDKIRGGVRHTEIVLIEEVSITGGRLGSSMPPPRTPPVQGAVQAFAGRPELTPTDSCYTPPGSPRLCSVAGPPREGAPSAPGECTVGGDGVRRDRPCDRGLAVSL